MEEIKLEPMETETAAEPSAAEEREERDYGREVRELYEARPELRGEELPAEVLQACIRGDRLTEAYNRYAGNQRQQAEQLRRENRALRQNAWAAEKAPVRGVSRGGAVRSGPEDPFLRGFGMTD